MEKPNAILTRGIRKEVLADLYERERGSIGAIAETLHLSAVQVTQLLVHFGIIERGEETISILIERHRTGEVPIREKISLNDFVKLLVECPTK